MLLSSEPNKVLLEDNNIYYLTWKLELNDKVYYYMISKNMDKVMVCEKTGDELIEIIDSELLKSLLFKINKQICLIMD